MEPWQILEKELKALTELQGTERAKLKYNQGKIYCSHCYFILLLFANQSQSLVPIPPARHEPLGTPGVVVGAQTHSTKPHIFNPRPLVCLNIKASFIKNKSSTSEHRIQMYKVLLSFLNCTP